MITIQKTVTAGTFADTSTNAEGNPVPDTYTWTSTADPSVATVNADGTATFTGTAGTFAVTATDPAGLSGSEDVEVVDSVPTAVGVPTFTPA
jgi:hypothetical protein